MGLEGLLSLLGRLSPMRGVLGWGDLVGLALNRLEKMRGSVLTEEGPQAIQHQFPTSSLTSSCLI